MTQSEEPVAPEETPEPPGEGLKRGEREPATAPEELGCPVCERIIPLPAPDTCPHCQAPIQIIMALLRTADLALEEARRDIRIGDLTSAGHRLELVRATSRRHRLLIEVIQAMIDRLRGEPATALGRLRAIRDKPELEDQALVSMIDKLESACVEDQRSLAVCCEHYNFALFRARRGHFEEARNSLSKALAEVPHHAESHALLGKVQLALRENEEARYHLKRAMASDPTNPTASRLLPAMARMSYLNPIEFIRARVNLSPAWTGSIIVIIILAVLALTALLNR